MNKLALLCCCIFAYCSAFSQKLVEVSPIETLTKEALQFVFGDSELKNGIEAYKVLYETPDIDGSIDTASGLLVIPLNVEDIAHPIVAYQHGTASDRTAVPSNMSLDAFLAYFLCAQGYIATAADFLGLGESRRKIHPYLHAKTEASAAIDLIRASKDYMDQTGIVYNEQLFVTGYSQGGHAAMALHRELEQYFSDEFEVTASSPMSGIYNLSGEVLATVFSDEPYLFPSYMVWIIVAYESVYGNIYDQIEDIFKPGYITMVKGFVEGAISRGELNDLMVNKLMSDFGASIPRLALLDNYIEDFQINPNNAWQAALRDNDLFDWVPVAPTRMMYCKADDQVFFTNSTFTDSVMNLNGALDVMAIDVASEEDHGGCVIPATLATIDFFAQYANPQLVLNTLEVDETLDFQVSPNPAKDHIQLIFSQLEDKFEELDIRLINVNGQIVQQAHSYNPQKFLLPLNDLPNGLYLLEVRSNVSFWTEKIVIKN